MLADRAVAALAEGGRIAQGLAASGLRPEVRAGQLEMARAVSAAIEGERVLMCEAGTGTGKTLAYLVPAILSGRRVVVSTATKALQEQIYAKDVPLLAAHLGVGVTAALMKGLGNYLCRRRLEEALASSELGDERKRTLAKIERWAKESETGDRVELSFLRDDDPAFRDVQSGSDTRIGQQCQHFQRCFVTQMRRAADEARLLVVNHHLYLADLALRREGGTRGFRGGGVIPEHDVVIFDEAHQLEDIGTEFFGTRVSSAGIESFGRDARRTLNAARAGLDEKLGLRLVEGMVAASSGFFTSMLRHSGPGEGRATLTKAAFDDDARSRMAKLDAALEALAGFAGSVARASGSDDVREPLGVIERRASAFRDAVARVLDPTREEVAWIEVRARSCALGVSPIEIATVLRQALFGEGRKTPTVVLTSATLATGQGPQAFAHARRRLGVVDADEAVVASPFDYRKNAGAYVPIDLPEPPSPEFLAAAGARVADLVRASRGGAFVLCASTRNMRSLHAYLRDEARISYPLLCQGERPKSTLLEEFRAARHAVLVATMGFWEGVDVPGHALRLVIIDKLPFAVPTDPVVAARHRAIEEQGRSAFGELSVPEAAIALKQGFGRLIRSTEDRGVVAILDKRLRTKGYGRALRMALPSASGLSSLDEVRSFFEIVVGVDQLPPADA